LQSFPRECDDKDMAAMLDDKTKEAKENNILLTSSKMAAMTSHATEELLKLF
jgi:hypothetical protein